MRLLFVLIAIWLGVAYATTTPDYRIFGGSVDGDDLITLGRKLNKPMLTLIGMALRNQHNHDSCGKWTPWSPCEATRRGMFSRQIRTRSCADMENLDTGIKPTESENKLCEGEEKREEEEGVLDCPVRYNLTSNGYCMKLNTTRVTYDVAIEQCQKEGGYLIHIDSQTKYDDFKSVLRGLSTSVHVDGRRTDSTSPWEYQYGSQSSVLKWQSGYPKDDADYLCLVYYIPTDTQFNYACSFERSFMCEILTV